VVRCDRMSNDVLRLEGEQAESAAEGSLTEDVCWLRNVTRALAIVYLATQMTGSRQRTGVSGGPLRAGGAGAGGAPEISQRLHELIDALPRRQPPDPRHYFEG